MAFPPPVDDYVEIPVAETLDDYLRPMKSAIHSMKATTDLNIRSICKGDAVTIDLGRNPHNRCVGLVEYEGDTFLAVLHWHKGRLFAQTDNRQGVVTEEMRLIGIARAVIKDQLAD